MAIVMAGVGAYRYRDHTQRSAEYAFGDEVGVRFNNAAEVVDAVRENLREHAISITIGYEAEGYYMDEARSMVDALLAYAMEPTDDPTEGDYIRYQYGGYELQYSRTEQAGTAASQARPSAAGEGAGTQNRYRLQITPTYYTDLEQELAVDEAVQEILNSLDLHWYSSDADKVAAVYQYLVSNVQYDTVRKNHKGYHLKTTAYAALVQHSAVCQGYCVAAYRLLRELGVECRIITGDATYEGVSEYHAWNLVRIGDVWYNLDITWDSYLETDQYYLRCDANFADHTRDAAFATEEFYETYPMSPTDYP